MKIRRVLISYKRTAYQAYAKGHPTVRMRRLISEKHHIARDMKLAHDTHLESIARVKSVLKKYKIAYATKRRNLLESICDFDLVVSIGGDGTFLRTSHFMSDHLPILGINSSPTHSVGALCSITSTDFERKLLEIVNGHAKHCLYTRLACRRNGKLLKEPILNDALVANTCPASATRALIEVRGRYEEQKSSGIWVSTPTGSTAATGAAGGTRIPKRDARLFQYVVREPYCPEGRAKPRLTRAVLKKDSALSIISEMGEGAVYIDGPRVHYPFNFGDELTFELSKYPLHVIL